MMPVPGNAEGKSGPVLARHRTQSSPEEVGMFSTKATQWLQSTGPQRSSANQLHRVREIRGEYLGYDRPCNAEGKSGPVPARHRSQSSPKQSGMLSTQPTQHWQSTGPQRSSANQLHRVRASRVEYRSDARPWQSRRQKRSCTCEAQKPELSRTDWDAQCKRNSTLAKHGTRAVQREPVAQSESELG